MESSKRQRRGFSLLELVIVVVIVGIIAAIAIPRMSRGAAGASDKALNADLAVFRTAIDLYAAEHNGTFPTEAAVEAQLNTYTDASGATSTTKTSTHIYGPYLRTKPPLPVGAKKSATGIAASDAAGVGWIYSAATGTIRANCPDTEVDATGTKYNTY